MSALLSVVVTTYNREKTIKRTIDSILAQTYNNFELIIVDDCSNDNTVSIIKNYDDKRIKLFQNEVNLGVEKNKNKAYEYVKGDSFVYIDSDDYYIKKTFFEDAMSVLDDPNVNMYIAVSNFLDGTGYKNNIGFSGKLKVKEYLNGYQKKYERAPQGSMIIKTEVFNKTGITQINCMDDVTMALGGIGVDGYVYGSNDNVMVIEQQGNSVTKKISYSLMNCHIYGTKKLYDYYVANNVLEDKEKWLTYQIKVLISFYMSSSSASLGHMNCIIKLLFKNNIPNKFSLIKSMILDYVYIKNKNRRENK